ncbi:MAG TPA: ribosome maturation factor RimP [Halanaerobiales bacterium]|nr:ribosome maturation factor RimP [Halanaerobiales bacterium]
MSRVVDIVKELAEPLVKTEGLNLVDVDYQKEGSDWILRVFIENLDGELTLKNCEDISKLLSAELDRKDPIDKQYILEVSSPGIERPLVDKEDFLRFKGELIEVNTYAPIDDKKEFRGELINFEDNKVIIDDKKGVIEIPFNKIAHANLTFDF